MLIILQNSKQWPEIHEEMSVDEYQESVVEFAKEKLNITFLPKIAQDDAYEIINVLKENLNDCKTKLASDHLMWQYRVCVHQYIDTAESQIADMMSSFPEKYDDDNEDTVSDTGNSSTNAAYLVPLNLILSYLIYMLM
jgi:hypothetical protein